MAPCVNKRVELDNCFFAHVFFLMCCSISFPLFELLNSAIHVDIIFMLFTLQSCVKLVYIKNETWKFLSGWRWERIVEMDFFVLFNQQTQSLFTNTMFFFCFMFHLICICKPAVLPQMISLFWWSLYRVYFDLSTLISSLPFLQSLLASCRSFLPCSTHTYTPFSNTIMNKMQWLKSKNLYIVTTDWWKLVKKRGWNEKKNELCGYLQWKRHCRSGHWVRKIPANHNTGNIEGNSVFRAIVVAS